jgi:hypothetical protein
VISTFALDEPHASGSSLRVSWRVSPESRLLRSDSFELHFPPSVDVERVPIGLLRIAALTVLHPLWILLRPCVVRLPFALPPDEAEFWQRLLDTEIASLEALRDTAFYERCIFFVYDGPALSAPEPLADSGRAAAALSGGKDSLLQAALLKELGCTPTLVTTTSPLPPLEDHLTQRRSFVLREAASRLDAPHVEVRTGARALWENGFAGRIGYPLAVSELTDAHLYFASLLIAGAATGATHLFLASEADVQTNAVHDGRFLQISHFMYSVATQAAISALLAPWNIRYTSLTSPIFNAQVQRMLWQRYPRIAELQYSCWLAQAEQSACSDCNQCLRIALGILAGGGDPRSAGFDPDRALGRAAGWMPKTASTGLPEALSRAHLSLQMIETVRAVDPAVARRHLGDDGFQAYRTFAERLGSEPVRHLGMRTSFGTYLDPLVREGALERYAQAFPGTASDDDATTASRTRDAIATITAPLAQRG